MLTQAVTMYWKDLGEVCLAPKKERPEKRDLDLLHLDMEMEALCLVCYVSKETESQRSQRPELSRLQLYLPLDLLDMK